MTVDSYETLTREIVARSVATTFGSAVTEWEVVALEEDGTASGVCVCGQPNLIKLFTIKNRLNDATLHPIGSVCINKFGREDLDRQVDLIGALYTLRAAVLDGRDVPLTSEYFSRAMLEYFHFRDVFTPDHWNGGHGDNDYEFLTKMFNKHDKTSITKPQQKKIYMLLTRKVFPFVVDNDLLA